MKKTMIAVAVAAMLAGPATAGFKIKDGDTLAFLGDSITQQGQDRHNHRGYVNLVVRGLANAGIKVKPVRAGISGHKSNDMLERLNRDVLSQRPDWMTLSCGVNDVWHFQWNKGVTLDEYRRNITAILDTCAASNCNVVVLTATPFTNEGRNEKRNAKLAPYNRFLIEEAARRRLPVADLNAGFWSALEAQPDVKLTRDGVHMLPKGDELMATGVLEALGADAGALARIRREAWREVWVLCRFDLTSAGVRARYVEAVDQVLAEVRAEPGCLFYSLMGDAETEWTAPQRGGDGVLWMIEHWDSVDSLKAHLETPHMRKFAPAAAPLRSGSTFRVLQEAVR